MGGQAKVRVANGTAATQERNGIRWIDKVQHYRKPDGDRYQTYKQRTPMEPRVPQQPPVVKEWRKYGAALAIEGQVPIRFMDDLLAAHDELRLLLNTREQEYITQVQTEARETALRKQWRSIAVTMFVLAVGALSYAAYVVGTVAR